MPVSHLPPAPKVELKDESRPSRDSDGPTGGLGKAADRLRSVRSRLRSNQHDAAHDPDEAGHAETSKQVKQTLKKNPLVHGGKARLIADDSALLGLIERLRQPGPDGRPATFAYDSEFIGESTYRPKLCLIQVATADDIALVDPLADVDLEPFWQLVGDSSVRKIVHAGEQDLEPAVRLAGVEPKNVLDTQVAAGFCQLPYPSSLAKLVDYVTSPDGTSGSGVRLGKGLTFSQWDQRPLSAKQLSYAADDVRFLPLVADWLDRHLAEDEQRREWCETECAARCSADALAMSEHPWDRVKGTGGLDGKQQAILRRLASWRETTAQREDLPPRVLVRDEVLVALSRRPVKDLDKLSQTRHLPRPVAEQYGAEMLSAIQAGKADDPVDVKNRAPEPSLQDKFTADAVWALLQTIGHARGIDPSLLASRRETELLVRRHAAGRDIDRHRLLTGWRREAAGERLLHLLDGGEFTLRLGS